MTICNIHSFSIHHLSNKHYLRISCAFIFSYIVGDKSILQDAGLEGPKDVEALPPPPEIKDNIPSQKGRGDVNYFICTRPGKGPVYVSDESHALLNPETGLPN